MPRQTSVQLTEATERQAAALKAAGFGTLTDIIRIAIDRMYQREIATMTTKTNVVWLYKDNAGGLYIGRGGGPWYEVDGKPGRFEDDALGFAYTDDDDFEHSLTDGKLDTEPQAKLVAKWEDGKVTMLDNTLVGSAPAGHAASAYLGIKSV
jgi:hypothetical protein